MAQDIDFSRMLDELDEPEATGFGTPVAEPSQAARDAFDLPGSTRTLINDVVQTKRNDDERQAFIAKQQEILDLHKQRFSEEREKALGPQAKAIPPEDDAWFGELFRSVGRAVVQSKDMAGATMRQAATSERLHPGIIGGDPNKIEAEGQRLSDEAGRLVRQIPAARVDDIQKIRLKSISEFARDTADFAQYGLGQTAGFVAPIIMGYGFGGPVGLGVAATTLGVGEVRQVLEEEGVTDPKLLESYGWTGGMMVAALDALVPHQVLTKEMRRGLGKYALTRIARTTNQIGIKEAITETMQEMVQITAAASAAGIQIGEDGASEEIYNMGKALYEKRWQLANAAALGYVGGKVLGGPGAVRAEVEGRRQDRLSGFAGSAQPFTESGATIPEGGERSEDAERDTRTLAASQEGETPRLKKGEGSVRGSAPDAAPAIQDAERLLSEINQGTIAQGKPEPESSSGAPAAPTPPVPANGGQIGSQPVTQPVTQPVSVTQSDAIPESVADQRVPTFNDLLEVLPRDAAGDADVAGLVERLGGRRFGELTDAEKIDLYQEYEAGLPEGSRQPATEAPATVSERAATAPATEAIAAPEAAQEAAPVLDGNLIEQPSQSTTAIDDAARSRFAEVLASKERRSNWGKAAGVSEEQVRTLIDEAVADGRLTMRKGQPVRTAKARQAPASPQAEVARAATSVPMGRAAEVRLEKIKSDVAYKHAAAILGAGSNRAAALKKLASDRKATRAVLDEIHQAVTGKPSKSLRKKADVIEAIRKAEIAAEPARSTAQRNPEQKTAAPEAAAAPAKAEPAKPTKAGESIKKFADSVEDLKRKLDIKTRPVHDTTDVTDISMAIRSVESRALTLVEQVNAVQRGSRIKIIAEAVTSFTTDANAIAEVAEKRAEVDLSDATLQDLEGYQAALSDLAQIVEDRSQVGYELADQVQQLRDVIQERMSEISDDISAIGSTAYERQSLLEERSEEIEARLDELREGREEADEDADEGEVTEGGEVLPARIYQEEQRIGREFGSEDSARDIAEAMRGSAVVVLRSMTDRAEALLAVDISTLDENGLQNLDYEISDVRSELITLSDWADKVSEQVYEKGNEAYSVIDAIHDDQLTPANDALDNARTSIENTLEEVDELLADAREIEAGEVIDIDGVEYGPTMVRNYIAAWKRGIASRKNILAQPDLEERYRELNTSEIARLEEDIARWEAALAEYEGPPAPPADSYALRSLNSITDPVLKGHYEALTRAGTAVDAALGAIASDRRLDDSERQQLAELYVGHPVDGDPVQAIREAAAQRGREARSALLHGFSPEVSPSNLRIRDLDAQMLETALQRLADRMPRGAMLAVRNALRLEVGDRVAALEGATLSPEAALSAFGVQAGVAKKIIAVSLEYGPDVALQTFTHEEIHLLRQLGILKGKDWEVLAGVAKRRPKKAEATRILDNLLASGKIDQEAYDAQIGQAGKLTYRELYQIDARYGEFLNGNEDLLVEETVAHVAADWAQGREFAAPIERALQKIRDFIEAIQNLIANGIGARSANDIFESIWAGELTRKFEEARERRFDLEERGIGLMRQEGVTALATDGQSMFAFAGEKAKTADLDALNAAKRMEAEGKGREFIWRETRWFRGVDGRWRFEIDDSKSKLRAFGPDMSMLGIELTHDPLFDAYPELLDVEFNRVPGPGGLFEAGGIIPPAISIGKGVKNRRSVTLHESQHAIQDVEQFAEGGSPRGFTKAEVRAEQMRLRNEPDPNDWSMIDNRDPDDVKTIRHSLYRKLAGEVEARAVQRRMNLTADEREDRPPWLDYDVPEDQQIIRMPVEGEQRSMASVDLDMSPEARKARAEAMGFDTSRVLYHGSASKFDAFSPSASPDGLIFLADSRAIASDYARRGGGVGEYYVRLRNPLVIDANGENFAQAILGEPFNDDGDMIRPVDDKPFAEIGQFGDYDAGHEVTLATSNGTQKKYLVAIRRDQDSVRRGEVRVDVLSDSGRLLYEDVRNYEGMPIGAAVVTGGQSRITDGGLLRQFVSSKLLEAKAAGYDGVVLRNGRDNQRPAHNQVVVFDPSNIRSVNAAFDPVEDGSPQLMAALRDWMLSRKPTPPQSTPEGESPSLNKIISDLKKTMGMTVSQGLWGFSVQQGNRSARVRPPSNVRGQFDRETGNVSVRQSRDIKTLAHEGGHYLESILGTDLGAIKQAHAEALTGDPAPMPAALSEGFANWFRDYILDPDAAESRAPGMTEAFEELLEAERPDMLAGFDTIQQEYQRFIKSAPINEVAAGLSSQYDGTTWRELSKDKALDNISGKLSSAYQGAIDGLNVAAKGLSYLLKTADANGIRDEDGRPISVKVGDNFYKRLRLFAGSFNRGRVWLDKGVSDLTTGRIIGPSLKAALEKALGGGKFNMQKYKDFNQYLVSIRAIAEYDRLDQKKNTVKKYDDTLAKLADARPMLAERLQKDAVTLERRQDALTRANAMLADRRRMLGVAETRLETIQDRLDGVLADIAEAGEMDAIAQEIDDPLAENAVSENYGAMVARRRRQVQNLERQQREAVRAVERLSEEVSGRDVEVGMLQEEIRQLGEGVARGRQQVAQLDDMVARIRKEREAASNRGASRPPTAEPRAVHERVIKELGTPEFQEAAKLVHDFTFSLLEARRQAGFITQEMFDELAKRRDWYVPFWRDMSDIEGAGAMFPGSGAKKWSMFKKFDGSDRSILMPLEILSEEAYSTAQQIAFNDMVKAMVGLAERVGPGGGKVAERLARSETMEANAETFDKIRKMATDLGVDEIDAHMITQRMEMNFSDGDIRVIMSPENLGPTAKPQLPMWENGERVMVRLPDPEFGRDLFEAINGLGKEMSDILVKALALPAQALRVGVTSHPDFIFRNIWRDIWTAWKLTGAAPFVTQFRGFGLINERGTVDGMSGEDFLRLYNEAGGIAGGINVNAQIADQRRDVKALLDTNIDPKAVAGGAALGGFTGLAAGSTVGSLLGVVFGGPVGAAVGFKIGATVGGLVGGIGTGYAARHGEVWRFVESFETATRLGVAAHAYKRAKEHNPDLSDMEAITEAAFVSRDIMDWNRRGSKMLAATRLVTFLNAQIQGLDKQLRQMGAVGDRGSALKKHLAIVFKHQSNDILSRDEERDLADAYKSYMRWGAITLMLMGLAALYADDDDYQDIKDETKATHSWFKALGIWFRLPKPFELAVPGNIGEIVWDRVAGRDQRMSERIVNSMYEVLAPPGLPQVMRLTGGLLFNRDRQGIFSGRSREIVGENLASRPPHERYHAFTSEFAIDLSRAMYNAGVPQSLIPAPVKTDFVLSAAGAYWGREVQNSYQTAKTMVGMSTRPDRKATDFPILRGFTGEAARMSRGVNDMWTMISREGGEFTMAATEYKQLMDDRGRPVEAEMWLKSLDPEQRVWALTQYYGSRSEKREHPLERASQADRINREIMRDTISDTLAPKVRQGRKTVRDYDEKIELTPAKKTEVIDILARLSQVEARNTMILMKRPGFEGMDVKDPQLLMDELKAASPPVHDLLLERRDKEVADWPDVVKEWPKYRDRVLKESVGAFN